MWMDAFYWTDISSAKRPGACGGQTWDKKIKGPIIWNRESSLCEWTPFTERMSAKRLLGLVPCNFLATCGSGSSTMLMDLCSSSCSVHSRAMRPTVGLAMHQTALEFSRWSTSDTQLIHPASAAACAEQGWWGCLPSWVHGRLRIINEMDCGWCNLEVLALVPCSMCFGLGCLHVFELDGCPSWNNEEIFLINFLISYFGMDSLVMS